MFILIFTCLLYSFEREYMIIDSLSGRAEVIRGENETWNEVIGNELLFDGDIIRTRDSTLAVLKSKDGDLLYLYENTQILLNLKNGKNRKPLFDQITVFYGIACIKKKEEKK